MNKISYTLLQNKNKRRHLQIDINFYRYPDELYNELESVGIVNRVKEIPQLGVIKVPRGLKKSRYDYMMLQLYLHKLIKNGLQRELQYTYNNRYNMKEFETRYVCGDKTKNQL